MAREVDFASIRGLRVGQAETDDRASGVTVVLFDQATPTVVDVRGGASATYDTASLALDATFGRRWAVFFSGGSLYGLDAARGIRTRILEAGGGAPAFRNPNPVVPISGAALFDLPRARGPIPDYLPLGYEAARIASRDPVAEGSVGAGAGATVGKYLGRHRAMRGGVGTAASWLAGRAAIGVLVVLNAVGGIRDPGSGRWLAGARAPKGGIAPPQPRGSRDRTSGTTLALVATDLELARPVLSRIAAMTHTGLASTIVPFHSSTDGDVVFAAATGAAGRPPEERRPGELADRLGHLAAELAGTAVRCAVSAANPPG